MDRRRLFLAGFALILIGLLVWFVTRRSTAPSPGGTASLINGQPAPAVSVPEKAAPASIDKGTVVPVTVGPIQPLQYLTDRGLLLAYDTTNGQLDFIDAAGTSTTLHTAQPTDFIKATANPSGDHVLVVRTISGGSANRFDLVNTSTGVVSTLAANIIDATWLSNGDLVYSQANQNVELFLAPKGDVGSARRVGQLNIAYLNHGLAPSPDGKQVAVLASADESGTGQPILIVSLDKGAITSVPGSFANTVWSPDSRYLFGITTDEIYNTVNATMVMWDVAAKQSTVLPNAVNFPATLASDGTSKYFAIKTTAGDSSQVIWSITLIDPKTKTVQLINYTPTLANAFSLYTVAGDNLFAAGSRAIYTTPLKPFLDDVRQNAR